MKKNIASIVCMHVCVVGLSQEVGVKQCVDFTPVNI